MSAEGIMRIGRQAGRNQANAAAEHALEDIRNRYGKPAHLGARVRYTGEDRTGECGIITGAAGGHLLVRLEGRAHDERLHPTWALQYI